MQAHAVQQIVKLEILESYYIDSKFRFHVISPAIVDEGDYVTSVDEENKSRPQNQTPAKKDEKPKQTILLIVIKNNEVYSYVRDSKLGKILGLNTKYLPKAISKHGLFIFAVDKKQGTYAVYEMTSGTLVKLVTKPFISSVDNMIPYVSEDGNFVILFDKLKFKMYFIFGIQQKNETDHAIDLKFQHADNFKLIDYPDLGGDMYKNIIFFPFKYRAVDAALGIKGENNRVFTMAMLLESKRGEVIVCIARIHTTDKAYRSHTIRFFRLEPSLHRDAGLYSLRLDDKDGDYLAMHCHNHHHVNSSLYFIKTAKTDLNTQDTVCIKLRNNKIILEYQWISVQQTKYLVYITRQFEIYLVDPHGDQVFVYFSQKLKNSIPLLSIFRRKHVEFAAIQLFNVNTEANLVLFFDKNVVSMDFSTIGDLKVGENHAQQENNYDIETKKLVLYDYLNDDGSAEIVNTDSKKKIGWGEDLRTEESKSIGNQSHHSLMEARQPTIPSEGSKKDLNQISQASIKKDPGESQKVIRADTSAPSVTENHSQHQRSQSETSKKSKKKWFSSLFGAKNKKSMTISPSSVSIEGDNSKVKSDNKLDNSKSGTTVIDKHDQNSKSINDVSKQKQDDSFNRTPRSSSQVPQTGSTENLQGDPKKKVEQNSSGPIKNLKGNQSSVQGEESGNLMHGHGASISKASIEYIPRPELPAGTSITSTQKSLQTSKPKVFMQESSTENLQKNPYSNILYTEQSKSNMSLPREMNNFFSQNNLSKVPEEDTKRAMTPFQGSSKSGLGDESSQDLRDFSKINGAVLGQVENLMKIKSTPVTTNNQGAQSGEDINHSKVVFRKEPSDLANNYINHVDYYSNNTGMVYGNLRGNPTGPPTDSSFLNEEFSPLKKDILITDTDKTDMDRSATSKGSIQPIPKHLRISNSWTPPKRVEEEKANAFKKPPTNINKNLTKSMWDDVQETDDDTYGLKPSGPSRASQNIWEMSSVDKEDLDSADKRKPNTQSSKKMELAFEGYSPTVNKTRLPQPQTAFGGLGSGLQDGEFNMLNKGVSPSFGQEERIDLKSDQKKDTKEELNISSKNLQIQHKNSQQYSNVNSQERIHTSSNQSLKRSDEAKSERKVDFVKKSVWSGEKLLIPGEMVAKTDSKKSIGTAKPLERQKTNSTISGQQLMSSWEAISGNQSLEFATEISPSPQKKEENQKKAETFRTSQNQDKREYLRDFKPRKMGEVLDERGKGLNDTDIMLQQLVSSPQVSQNPHKIEFGPKLKVRKSRESQEEVKEIKRFNQEEKKEAFKSIQGDWGKKQLTFGSDENSVERTDRQTLRGKDTGTYNQNNLKVTGENPRFDKAYAGRGLTNQSNSYKQGYMDDLKQKPNYQEIDSKAETKGVQNVLQKNEISPNRSINSDSIDKRQSVNSGGWSHTKEQQNLPQINKETRNSSELKHKTEDSRYGVKPDVNKYINEVDESFKHELRGRSPGSPSKDLVTFGRRVLNSSDRKSERESPRKLEDNSLKPYLEHLEKDYGGDAIVQALGLNRQQENVKRPTESKDIPHQTETPVKQEKSNFPQNTYPSPPQKNNADILEKHIPKIEEKFSPPKEKTSLDPKDVALLKQILQKGSEGKELHEIGKEKSPVGREFFSQSTKATSEHQRNKFPSLNESKRLERYGLDKTNLLDTSLKTDKYNLSDNLKHTRGNSPANLGALEARKSQDKKKHMDDGKIETMNKPVRQDPREELKKILRETKSIEPAEKKTQNSPEINHKDMMKPANEKSVTGRSPLSKRYAQNGKNPDNSVLGTEESMDQSRREELNKRMREQNENIIKEIQEKERRREKPEEVRELKTNKANKEEEAAPKDYRINTKERREEKQKVEKSLEKESKSWSFEKIDQGEGDTAINKQTRTKAQEVKGLTKDEQLHNSENKNTGNDQAGKMAEKSEGVTGNDIVERMKSDTDSKIQEVLPKESSGDKIAISVHKDQKQKDKIVEEQIVSQSKEGKIERLGLEEVKGKHTIRLKEAEPDISQGLKPSENKENSSDKKEITNSDIQKSQSQNLILEPGNTLESRLEKPTHTHVSNSPEEKRDISRRGSRQLRRHSLQGAKDLSLPTEEKLKKAFKQYLDPDKSLMDNSILGENKDSSTSDIRSFVKTNPKNEEKIFNEDKDREMKQGEKTTESSFLIDGLPIADKQSLHRLEFKTSFHSQEKHGTNLYEVKKVAAVHLPELSKEIEPKQQDTKSHPKMTIVEELEKNSGVPIQHISAHYMREIESTQPTLPDVKEIEKKKAGIQTKVQNSQNFVRTSNNQIEIRRSQTQMHSRKESDSRYAANDNGLADIGNTSEARKNQSYGKSPLNMTLLEDPYVPNDTLHNEKTVNNRESLPEIRKSWKNQNSRQTLRKGVETPTRQKQRESVSFKEVNLGDRSSFTKSRRSSVSRSKEKEQSLQQKDTKRSIHFGSKDKGLKNYIESRKSQTKSKPPKHDKGSGRQSSANRSERIAITAKTEVNRVMKTSNPNFQFIDIARPELPGELLSQISIVKERPSPLQREELRTYLKKLAQEENEFHAFCQYLQMFKDLPEEENKRLDSLEKVINTFKEEVHKELPDHLAKKLWLLLVQNLIKMFLKLKKEIKNYPKNHFIRLAAMYSVVKDQLKKYTDYRKKAPFRRRYSFQKPNKLNVSDSKDYSRDTSPTNKDNENRKLRDSTVRRSRSLQPAKGFENYPDEKAIKQLKDGTKHDVRSSLYVDKDKDKIFKKLLQSLSDSDFSLVKVIKHLQVALISNSTPITIIGTSFFFFITFLKTFISAVLDTENVTNSIKIVPSVLYRDILDKLGKINQLDDLERHLSNCSTKRLKYEKRLLKRDEAYSIQYREMNIVNLALYLTDFLNCPKIFNDIVRIFFAIKDPNILEASKYLILILIFLKEKLDLFTQKSETLKIIKDKTVETLGDSEATDRIKFGKFAQDIREVSLEIFDTLATFKTFAFEPATYSTRERFEPGKRLSLPVCLSENIILSSDNFLMERACAKSFSELRDILRSMKSLSEEEPETASTFWTFLLVNMRDCFQKRWFNMTQLEVDDLKTLDLQDKFRSLNQELKAKAFFIMEIFYELAYFLNCKNFLGDTEDSSRLKFYLRTLYRTTRSLYFCYLKVQLERVDLNRTRDKEKNISLMCEKLILLMNLLLFIEYQEYEDQTKTQHELVCTIELLSVKGEYIQQNMKPFVKQVLKLVDINIPSIAETANFETLARKLEGSKDFTEEEKPKGSGLSLVTSLFPKGSVIKRVKEKETSPLHQGLKKEYVETDLFNDFIQKVLELQSSEFRAITGFEKFYKAQKAQCEEVMNLYSKVQKKYAPIFANQRKQTCNLLFNEGSWIFISFPSQIKPNNNNVYSNMYY